MAPSSARHLPARLAPLRSKCRSTAPSGTPPPPSATTRSHSRRALAPHPPCGLGLLGGAELGAALPSGPDYAPKCRFAGKEGASKVATGTLAAGDTTVRCTTPATGVADGPIGVELSLNGQQYTSLAQTSALYQATSAAPASGPAGCGTLVKIGGTALDNCAADGVTCECRFGDSAAVVAAPTGAAGEVACMQPPTGVGNVPVQLRMVTAAGDACVDSSNTLRFVVRPPPEISAAEPLSGFQTGGAQVWVKGIGFAQSTALACRFGDAPAAVEFFGASEVKCTSPKVDADTLAAPIQLTLNGQQWFPPVADAPEFLYSRVPKPERLEPASAPVGVALKIAVSGADLDGGTDYRCAFGPLETPAVWSAADGAVLCALPQQADTGTLQFALSLNGIDFVATPLEFTRYARPTVSMVTPAAGAIVQESRLVLHGSGFGGGTSYTCRFDGAAVAANLSTTSASRASRR